MKYYLAKVTFNDPYPKSLECRVEANNIALGVYRAAKECRKANKGKRMRDLLVSITQYESTKTI